MSVFDHLITADAKVVLSAALGDLDEVVQSAVREALERVIEDAADALDTQLREKFVIRTMGEANRDRLEHSRFGIRHAFVGAIQVLEALEWESPQDRDRAHTAMIALSNDVEGLLRSMVEAPPLPAASAELVTRARESMKTLAAYPYDDDVRHVVSDFVEPLCEVLEQQHAATSLDLAGVELCSCEESRVLRKLLACERGRLEHAQVAAKLVAKDAERRVKELETALSAANELIPSAGEFESQRLASLRRQVASQEATIESLRKQLEAAESIEATGGVSRIAKERHRQMTVEGYDAFHDVAHTNHELARAAAFYALAGKWPWPWGPEPTVNEDRIRDLEKAGALIAAELDRLLAIEEVE